MKNTNIEKLPTELDKLIEVFGEDQDLFLFYLKWIEHGLNATKAYMALHPNVDAHSASVLGSRMLGKVSKEEVMRAYGLDLDVYMTQLREGLKAMKVNEFDGSRIEDHMTRKPYHDKLGKHLGLEADSAKTLIQNNINNNFLPLNDFVKNIDKRIEEEE